MRPPDRERMAPSAAGPLWVAALVVEGVERLALDPSPQLGLFDPSRRPAQAAAPGPADAPMPEFLEEVEPPAPCLAIASATL